MRLLLLAALTVLLGIGGELVEEAKGEESAKEEERDTVTLVADSWMPINGDPTSETPGYAIEIAQAVFRKEGMKLEYRLLPWKRALTLVKQGQYDGAVGVGTSESKGLVVPSEPIGISTTAFLGRKGETWRYRGIDSLRGRKLGAILGYEYVEEVDTYIEGHKNTTAVQLADGENALEMNIRKLQAGRIDTLISEEIVFFWTLRSMGLSPDEFVNLGQAGGGDPLFIAFTPIRQERSERLAAILSRGIVAMRASGDLEVILSRYGLTDWKKTSSSSPSHNTPPSSSEENPSSEKE